MMAAAGLPVLLVLVLCSTCSAVSIRPPPPIDPIDVCPIDQTDCRVVKPGRPECFDNSGCLSHQMCCQVHCGMKCLNKTMNPIDVCPIDQTDCTVAKPGRPECFDNSGCLSHQMCCKVNCGMKCLNKTITIKPGKCPQPWSTLVPCKKPLGQNCNPKDDSSCGGNQKCCIGACSYICRDPEAPVTKPGKCPPPIPTYVPCKDPIPKKDQHCILKDDSSCGGKQKCCIGACNHICRDPEEPTDVCPPQLKPLNCTTVKVAPECFNNTGCPDKHVCCKRDCTMKCVNPTIKPGKCSAERICKRPTYTCSSDSECEGDQKCCINPSCGQYCCAPERELPSSA